MSTVSTSINSSATVFLSDHFKKYIHPNPSEKLSMRVLFISSFVMGGLSILVGLAFSGVTSALEAWWALSSIFSGGILGLFLLGFISRKTRSKEAGIGVLIGVLVIGWMSLSPVLLAKGEWTKFQNPLHANMTIVMGTLTIFIVGFIMTWLAKRQKS
jgi:SSS family solute:Na+ symporter